MIFLFFFLIWCFFESGLGAVFVSIILIDLFFFVFLEICSRITFCLGIWFHKVCNECHFGLFFHFFNITLKKAENDGLYPYVLKSCLWCSYRWHVYKQTVYEPTSNITEHSGMSSESWTLLICWVQPPHPGSHWRNNLFILPKWSILTWTLSTVTGWGGLPSLFVWCCFLLFFSL